VTETGRASGRDIYVTAADLLVEPFWSLTARAALALDERAAAAVRDALLPVAGEISGVARAMLTVGPVSDHLIELQHFTPQSEPGSGENDRPLRRTGRHVNEKPSTCSGNALSRRQER
jgi:hypothetical protein